MIRKCGKTFRIGPHICFEVNDSVLASITMRRNLFLTLISPVFGTRLILSLQNLLGSPILQVQSFRVCKDKRVQLL